MDSPNVAWLLTSASLVLLMTPGLAFFYGGMGRSKSVLNMMMMSFSSIGVVGVLWVLLGFSISGGNGGSNMFFGDPFGDFGMQSVFAAMDGDTEIAGDGLILAGFGATFAIITVALISGSIADRVKFGSWVTFAGLWAILVYSPVAYWVWGGGLLSGDGIFADFLVAPQDIAGGTVVHINAGAAGLVLALITGVRTGFGKEPFKPHNLPFVMLGAAILWFGWFGFNAGSWWEADVWAAQIWVNTLVAPAAAMLAWLLTEKIRDGKSTTLGAASGVVAGLVAITPAGLSVSPLGALAIGALAGVGCALAVGLKYKLGYDDSLDVVGVHLVGGLIGTLAIGFFATDANAFGDAGLFYGGSAALLGAQALSALIVIAYSAVATAIIAFAIKYTIGLRVSEDVETGSIDLHSHGEVAYDDAK